MSDGKETRTLHVVEEMIVQEGFEDFRAGRIEVWGDGPYEETEGRFFVTEEVYQKSIKPLDGVEVRLPFRLEVAEETHGGEEK